MSKLNLDQFEKTFIYKCLTDEQYFSSVIDNTDIDYIKCDNKRHVYRVIKDFFERCNTIPSSTEIRNFLNTREDQNAFKTVLTEIGDIDKVFNEDELYKNTEQYLKERAVYKTILEVGEDLSSNRVDTSAILQKFEKTCNIDLTTNYGIELFKDTDKIIHDLTKTEPVISSGWKWLDEKLDGGFQTNGRAMYIFAGLPNIGKSIVLGNIAQNIAKQGKNVLLITLEMSEMMYARRFCSSLSKIPIRQLKTDTTTLEKYLKELRQNPKQGRIYIKEFPPSTISPRNINSFIKKIKNAGIRIDAVCLDYINLLTTTFGSNTYERIKHICEQVRALSYIFSCPFITLTQFNRSQYQAIEPSMESIGESYGMSATADFMAGIYQLDEDVEHGIIRLGLMKNRFGPNHGNNAFKIDYSTLSIDESTALANLTDDANTTQDVLAMLSQT
jgi:replicative DNA helicase